MSKKAIVIILSLMLTLMLVISSCTTTSPPPSLTSVNWTAVPPLPEGSPPMPPKVVGSTTLPRYTGPGVKAFKTQQFVVGRLPYEQWADMYIVDIVVKSSAQSYFCEQEPGFIYFAISPESEGWGTQGETVILDNFMTTTDERYMFTTHIRCRAGLDSDTNPWCRLELRSYVPDREVEVSWEIYVWE